MVRFCRYPFEVTLDFGASITALDEVRKAMSTRLLDTQDGALPPMPFNFKPISELGAIPVGETCDVLGVVSVREEAGSVTTRFGQRTKRQVWALCLDASVVLREVTLVDDSGASIVGMLGVLRSQDSTVSV